MRMQGGHLRLWVIVAALVKTLHPSVATAQHRVVLILDASGSMWAEAGGEVKITTAKKATKNLIQNLQLAPDATLSLVVYGHRKKDDCDDIERFDPVPYAERTKLLPLIDKLSPKGKTPIANALLSVGESLKDQEGAVSVLLVTDGIESCGKDPCAVAQQLCERYGIEVMKVNVVGFDIQESQDQLECVARVCHGRYFSASNPGELATAFEDVKADLIKADTGAAPPAMTKGDGAASESEKTALFEDHFDRDELGEAYEVLDSDPNRMALNGDKLLIVATNPVKNRLNLQQAFPSDFVATVAVTMQVTPNNWVGLSYIIDDKNSLLLRVDGQKYYNASDARRLQFTKLVSGQKNDISSDIRRLGDRDLNGFSQKPEIWYLQLERVGVKYTGRISADGKRWVDVGSHTILQKNGRLGLRAGSGEGGIENPAEFDDFVVKPVK